MSNELEQQLRKLGVEWPIDESFVDRVISRIDSEPSGVDSPDGRRRSATMRATCVTIAAIMAGAGLFWLVGWQTTGSALYAQVSDALKQVQTIHEVATAQTDDGRMHQFAETWFARGRGFSLVRDDSIRIDNGTYFWDYKRGAKTASRTKSMGTDELLDQSLSLREQLERDCERFSEGDRIIDGVNHDCYRLTFHGPVKPADPSMLDFDKRRTLIFISPKSLPTLAEMQEKVDADWKVRLVRAWKYDVQVDPKVFEPRFPEGVRVIDVDRAFEQLTAIENVVHTEERAGLIYTIHQAKRFEHGGVMVMSSVRGSAETLAKFPLTRRMLQPGRYFVDGPAVNYEASPQGSDSFRLSLAKANHQGIDIEWWMQVPRGVTPNGFEDQDGRVLLKPGITPRGEYGKANHADERGVIHHINWDLPLDIPKPDRLPSLDEIAASVHADLSLLKGMTFPGQLNMGVKEIDGVLTTQFGVTDEVSPEEFARAAREHWLWWERGDVDFQIKSGGTTYGYELGGGGGLKPAVMVDHLSAVDDTTLARAAERSDLIVISARGTKITDAGLAHLKSLKRLKKLDVAETAITDAGLQHLETMTSLESLILMGTAVTQSGIDRLQKSLPGVVIVSRASDAGTAASENVASSADVPQSLPATLTGKVIDSSDQPIANAQVTVLIRTFSKDMHEELKGPLAWTATTDDKGRYSLTPAGVIHPGNEIRIRVAADGFANVSDSDYERKTLEGVIPTVRMTAGRQISGRLVGPDVIVAPDGTVVDPVGKGGPDGRGVAEAIVRFHGTSENLSVMWDSGPFPVNADGRFSLFVPTGATIVGAVYPQGFAPRFIDVTAESDQGDIALEKGVTLKGRVVDKNGQGVARTVVGLRNTERRITFAFVNTIATAVRTNESGEFLLPALKGSYELSVGRSLADFSRQMMLDGETPPAITPVTIQFDSSTPNEDILLHP